MELGGRNLTGAIWPANMTLNATMQTLTLPDDFGRALASVWMVTYRTLRSLDRMDTPVEAQEAAEARLLQRVAAGDADAFGELYDRFAGTLMAVATKILGDAAQAEDVLQDVFVLIWERAASYDAKLGKPLSWAVVMTRNKAIDRLRSAQRGRALLDRVAQEWMDEPLLAMRSSPGGDGSDTAKIVRTVLADLPGEQRQAIELAFFSGLSQSEISDQLGQPLGTVKARIRRGMLKLRDQLEGRL
jgi:RNA polymerase sigma-70 factor (ECF subfamily)